jgi:DNA polymerase I-like protein with 3'-5' exonuclease and polymerase domains
LSSSDTVFDRGTLTAWEAERYQIPLVAYRKKTALEVPLSYVVDVALTGDPDDVTVLRPTVRMEYFYVTEDEEIPHFLAWVERNALRLLGDDLETSSIDPMDGKIATLQLGNPLCAEPRAYVFDMRCVSLEAMAPVFDLLRDPAIVKVGQNLKFECKWSQHHWGVKIRNVADTQVTELVIRAGLWNAKTSAKTQARGQDRAAYKYTSMARLTGRYLGGLDIDKDHDLRTGFFKTEPGEHSLRQIVYAASDVVYPFYILQRQKEHVEARKLRSVVKIEYQLIPVLADMELTGFRMDVKRWRVLWQEAVKGRAEAETALDRLMLGIQPDLFGATDPNVRPLYLAVKGKPKPLNYSSSAQVKWALKQYCQQIAWTHQLLTTLPEIKKVKARAALPYTVGEPAWLEPAREWLAYTGKTVEDLPDYFLPEDTYCVLLAADKTALILAKCRKQLPAEIVDLLLDYSKFDIRCDTFGNDFLKKHLRPETGCVHTEFHQCITATGRLSSSPNLQNIPNDPRYRRCFVPRAGYVFVICDYSQIEPRITAQVSQDETYTLTFHTNDDLYLAVAEAMLGHRPDKKTPEGKLERAIFKTVVLALAYNMGPHKLRDRLTLALHKEIVAGQLAPPTFVYAKELYDRFFEVHNKVREAQRRAIDFASPTQRKRVGTEDVLVPNARRIWDDFMGAEVTWVTAPCGRKRFFPPDTTSAYTEAPNVEPQAGSATITKAAAVLLQRHIDTHHIDAHLVNLVHDEVVVMVRGDVAVEFANDMKRILEQAGSFYCPDIPIKAEFPEGTNGVTHWWTKEVKEEELAELEGDDNAVLVAA